MPYIPEFEVEAAPVTAGESGVNGTPDWAEIRLTRSSQKYGAEVIYFTRAASHDTIEQLRGALNPRGGNTITKSIWEELDAAVDEVLSGAQKTSPAHVKAQGVAHGLSVALAILRNPAEPNVESIKKEARERARARRE